MTSTVQAAAHSSEVRCRFCRAVLDTTFVDLGMSPLCQTHITPEQLGQMEPFYPLHVRVCSKCLLVQLPEFVAPADIFTEYAYFSSYSDSWVAHARRYCDAMRERWSLGPNSLVMEIASNDGYLLQHFVAQGIPCRGIEPAANVARVAVEKGIPTTVEFLGRETAMRIRTAHGAPDLLLGNNVLAHVPDINDFVGGMKLLLGTTGVITMEFPHLQRLIEQNQFDTIYHEHFSYLSFTSVETIFAAHGLTVFDVEELPTHGGSLRIYARHVDDPGKPVTERARELLLRERALGFDQMQTYGSFGERVKATKRSILSFLIDAKAEGKSVVGYGAPGKGNTLLNYCGIRTDLLDYTVDRNPYKQGKYTPGTRIPILDPSEIARTRPDYVFVLPWNLKDEIMTQLEYIRGWGGRFVIPIPQIRVE